MHNKRAPKKIPSWLLIFILTCYTLLTGLPNTAFANTEEQIIQEDASPEDNPQTIGDIANIEVSEQNNTYDHLITGQTYLFMFKQDYINNQISITKGAELGGIASSENTIQLIIGEDTLSIDKNDVEMIGATENGANHVLEKITAKGTFTIFKDSQMTIPLVTSTRTMSLNVLEKENHLYTVDIGNTTGYLPIDSAAVEQAQATENSYSATIIADGNLLSADGEIAGTIHQSNTSYTVEPASDPTKVKMTIGNHQYLIDKSLTSTTDRTTASQASTRNEIIQLKENSTIYSDSNLTTAAVSLSQSDRIGIVGVNGSSYEVLVGQTVGYVPILSTMDDFTVQLKSDAKIYADSNKSQVLAINTNTSTVYTVSRTEDTNLFLISIGDYHYYVEYSDLIFTEDSITLTDNLRKDTLTTKAGFILYKDASTKTPLVKNGLANQRFTVVGITGQYYRILFGGTVAYLPAKYATGFGPNKEISTIGSSILYKKVKDNYYPFGTLKSGFTFKPTSANSKYYLFTKDNITYAVEKSAAAPTNKSATLTVKQNASFPITLYTENNIAVYDETGNHIGALYTAKGVDLLGISKDKKRAIINFMGQSAQVKFEELYHKDIVNGKSTVSYSKMSYYIEVLSLLYPEFTEREIIGYSAEGRAIYGLRVGTGDKEILMDASFHAREHMTTNVLLEMIDTYSFSFNRNAVFNGWDVRNTLNKVSIWFLPMMNPDGVTLVQQGISALKDPKNISYAKAYAKDGSFKSWKANGRGVDLNQNFGGVSWDKIPSKKNYRNYKGPSAFSEPETQAFVEFVNEHRFKTNLSYHSSGSIIYWGGVQTASELERDRKLVNKIANLTGYNPIKPKGAAYNYKYGSGNSTAWMIKEKRIPAITIEIATYQGEIPVALNQWTSIWNKNRTIGLHAAKEAASR
ncbi:M14 family zinc carboxypeptidase [Ureibacillus sinduriensis]|uniref:M14 family zinc carboxypeptidase n=1 Tax=Ureibacillus sinduriensis TaxID=561440 RepID=UPI00068EE326|nr:M14 family zinc carboxypeptidase [Ureibacillus sinduriensis]